MHRSPRGLHPAIAAILFIWAGSAAAVAGEVSQDGRLIALWTFNEPFGAVCSDSGPAGLEASASGRGGLGVSRNDGVFGKCLSLSGDHSIEIPGKPDLDGLRDLSLSAWVLPTDLSGLPRDLPQGRRRPRVLFSFQEDGTILSLGLNVGGYVECDAPIDPAAGPRRLLAPLRGHLRRPIHAGLPRRQGDRLAGAAGRDRRRRPRAGLHRLLERRRVLPGPPRRPADLPRRPDRRGDRRAPCRRPARSPCRGATPPPAASRAGRAAARPLDVQRDRRRGRDPRPLARRRPGPADSGRRPHAPRGPRASTAAAVDLRGKPPPRRPTAARASDERDADLAVAPGSGRATSAASARSSARSAAPASSSPSRTTARSLSLGLNVGGYVGVRRARSIRRRLARRRLAPLRRHLRRRGRCASTWTARRSARSSRPGELAIDAGRARFIGSSGGDGRALPGRAWTTCGSTPTALTSEDRSRALHRPGARVARPRLPASSRQPCSARSTAGHVLRRDARRGRGRHR